MRILVSACLMGLCTRYDGGHNENKAVLALMDRHVLIPACPEQLGGLPTPRMPCEQVGERVMSREGRDCTAAFELGAKLALRTYELCGCEAAILKARSPSCGKGPTYDGSFTRSLTNRPGVFAGMLLKRGVPVYSEEDAEALAAL